MLILYVIAVALGFCWYGRALENPPDSLAFPPVRNANHIFNAIHSSMRQWGSSLNHNGMSLFPALVPKGTVLYHGNSLKAAVTGMEWVAFERDHAYNFARLYMTPSPGRPDHDGEGVRGSHPVANGKTSIENQQNSQYVQRLSSNADPIWAFPGYFHIYRARKDLHLLYIDGSSAADTNRGTLDTQDLLLRNDSHARTDAEFERARHLCRVAAEDWDGRIDGFIRMEAGFEIIICSFATSLDLVEALRSEDGSVDGNLVTQTGNIYHWLRAAASRYDGIGGAPRRVQLNYDTFLTAFAYSIDLFQNGSTMLPRLTKAPEDVLDQMRNDLKSMILQPDTFVEMTEKQHDWQMVADMIVQKYANPLQYLTNSSRFIHSSRELAQELHYMLRIYVDTGNRDPVSETRRCASEFMPTHASPASLSGHAIYTVSYHICSTLFRAYWSLRPWSVTAEQTDRDGQIYREQLTSLENLVTYLAWTEWKKCRGCLWDEFCSIPMFPFGFAEDHERPRCRNEQTIQFPMDYWSDDWYSNI